MKSAPVWVWLPDAIEPMEAGSLSRKDDATGIFSYSDAYKRSAHKALDPKELRYVGAKTQYAIRAGDRSGIPGIIADAGPDYWGMYVLSQEIGRELDAFDALVHAPDDSFGNLAVGALAEKQPLRLMELPRLARAIQSRLDGTPLRTHAMEDLMLSPDTALGGAKPKASILIDGFPWIAKFPDKGDLPDMPYYEAAAMRIAPILGIDAATVAVEQLPGDRSVLLVKRFDRRPNGSRIAAASALTVMGAAAQVALTTARTYNHFLRRATEWVSPENKQGLGRQIWDRIAYNGLVANTDDHPRNHAMLHDGGWQLSPLFDVVPGVIPREQAGLAMPFVSLDDGTRTAAVTAENLVKAGPLFGYGVEEAHARLIDMAEVILDRWESVLSDLDAPPRVYAATRATLAWTTRLLEQARALDLDALQPARKTRKGWKWAP